MVPASGLGLPASLRQTHLAALLAWRSGLVGPYNIALLIFLKPLAAATRTKFIGGG